MGKNLFPQFVLIRANSWTEIHYSLPITNHQSPITNHQSPITNHQSPITSSLLSCHVEKDAAFWSGAVKFYEKY
ncbi:hypothetical protein CR161_03020 [Prosthecochloris sp. ZM]|nr:hypothetical protein CR161_03020 [Prosthecochloris sp. ZM]